MGEILQQFSLAGKTALITGAGSGIGFAIAKGLAEAGARIVLNGRNRAKLARAREALADAVVETLQFDVTDQAAVAAAIDRFETGAGAIDILVNNAGMIGRAPLDEFDPAVFDRLLKTNVNGAFYTAQAVARHMIPRGHGKIINIASALSAVARKSVAPYAASKGAIANLTRGMATDWAAKGLQANAIAPGYFRTELNEALVSDAAFSAWLQSRVPAGRWGEVAELQGAAIFLASGASDFVNGHVLYVDGGITACL